MKNIYIKLGVCLLAAISLIACKKENELAFSPNSSTVSVYVGEKTTLSVNSYGVKSSDPYKVNNVEWSVDDNYVASIDNEGVLTGLKCGVARACGKFDGGKVVYIDVLVQSVNNQYIEPMLKGSYSDVADYEKVLNTRKFRRGVADKYAVYRGVEEGNIDLFQIYFFNQFNGGVITVLANEEDVNAVKSGFLPDRYNVTGENSFADNENNEAITVSGEFGSGVFYNFGEFNSKLSEVYAQYAADAKEYLESVANKESYTKEALGLLLPFELSADQTEVDGYKNDACNVIDGGTDFTNSENAVFGATDAITDLYLASARTWAKEKWCWVLHSIAKGDVMNGGLRKGHVQEEYYEVAWDRILDLDEQLDRELGKLFSFSEIDSLAQSFGIKYTEIASVSNVTSFEKQVNSNFTTIQSKHKKDFNDNCWNQMIDLRDGAIEYMKSIYSYNEMQSLVKKCSSGEYDKEGGDSYYKDVPTKSVIEANVADLDKAWAMYNESDYTRANWKLMVSTYESTMELLKNSVSKKESTEALAEAQKFFFDMPKK